MNPRVFSESATDGVVTQGSWLYHPRGWRVWAPTRHACAPVCKLMETLPLLPHLCLRDLLPKKLELPYFVSCNIPSVKNRPIIYVPQCKKKRIKYDAMLCYH